MQIIIETPESLDQTRFSTYIEEKKVDNNSLNNIQVRRGVILAVIFLLFRLVIAKLWTFWFGMEYHLTGPFLIFLSIIFLVMSVGLVYFGFTRWVGVDLKSWWYKRGRIFGDIKWGIGAIIAGVLLIFIAGIVMFVLNIMPENLFANQDGDTSLANIPINLVLGWFFGFAIASFGEESIFRGFLQKVFSQKYGGWAGNLLQAFIFSLSHLGMEPLGTIRNAAFLLLFRFVAGLLFWWLKMKRGTLLTSGIVHGFIG